MEPGAQRSRRQARPEEGHDRDEQALHAGGGREAARLRRCRSCSPGRRGTAYFPIRYAERLAGEVGERPHRRDPRRERPSCRSTSPQRVADEIASFVETGRRVGGAGEKTGPFPEFSRKVQVFRPTGGNASRAECDAPYEDGELWPSRSSTRTGPAARWRGDSTKPLRAATSGLWRRRLSARSEPDLSPWPSSSSRMVGSAAAVRTQEPARAVVVGVVQEQDVAGRGVGRGPTRDRRGGRAARPSPSPTATRAPAASRGAGSPAARRR